MRWCCRWRGRHRSDSPSDRACTCWASSRARWTRWRTASRLSNSRTSFKIKSLLNFKVNLKVFLNEAVLHSLCTFDRPMPRRPGCWSPRRTGRWSSWSERSTWTSASSAPCPHWELWLIVRIVFINYSHWRSTVDCLIYHIQQAQRTL